MGFRGQKAYLRWSAWGLGLRVKDLRLGVGLANNRESNGSRMENSMETGILYWCIGLKDYSFTNFNVKYQVLKLWVWGSGLRTLESCGFTRAARACFVLIW